MINNLRQRQFLLGSAVPVAAIAALFVALVPAENACHAVIDQYHNAYFSEENAFFEVPDDDFALYNRAMECIDQIKS
ncbi:MAG: hypothetical protein AB8B62_04740 [Roseobacter sp.]